MVIILMIFHLSKIWRSPLTFLIRFSSLDSISFWHSFIAVSLPPERSSNALPTSSVQTMVVVNRAIWALYPSAHSSLGLSPVSHKSAVPLADSNISYRVSLILNSSWSNHASTAPSQTNLEENGTFSSSLEIIPIPILLVSLGLAGGSNYMVFNPSKQSPRYSQTLGAF